MTEVASIVLFSADARQTIAFYRALGVALEPEEHGDGVAHAAVDLGTVHVAVLPATEEGPGAPRWRASGTTFAGFYVESLDATLSALAALARAGPRPAPVARMGMPGRCPGPRRTGGRGEPTGSLPGLKITDGTSGRTASSDHRGFATTRTARRSFWTAGGAATWDEGPARGRRDPPWAESAISDGASSLSCPPARPLSRSGGAVGSSV